MSKQPKYFLSNKKPVRPVTPAPVVEKAVPSEHASLPNVTSRLNPHMTRIASVVGLGMMVSLLFLVSLSTGVIHAIHWNSPLPILFPKFHPGTSVIAQAAAQPIGQGISFDLQTADARVEIVRSFLERYKSPLRPYDQYALALVNAADRYNLDYRLLPAIMMQESNLCKSADPSLHNCLGFGITATNTLGFDTYEESFDAAAKTLKANYIDQGLTTPEQIMHKYTPSSNGSWADSVNQWIAEMEHNDRQVGLTATADANLLEYTASR